MDQKHKP